MDKKFIDQAIEQLKKESKGEFTNSPFIVGFTAMGLQDKDPEYQEQQRQENERRKAEQHHENVFISTFCIKLTNKFNQKFKDLNADLRVKHYKECNSIIFYGSCFYEVNIYKSDLTFINDLAYENFNYDSMMRSYMEHDFKFTESTLKYFQEDNVTELNLYGKLNVRFNQLLRNVIRQFVKKGYINLEDVFYDQEVCFVSEVNNIYCNFPAEELLKFIK